MNIITIYDGVTNAVKAMVKPQDSSEQYKLKNQEDKIILDFNLNSFVIFDINDYIVYDRQEYYMRRMPKVKEQPAYYEYNIEFIGGIMLLKDAKYLIITDVTTGKVYTDNTFYVARTPTSLLKDIISNMNRVSKLKYNEGIVSPKYADSVMSLLVADWNCLEAINEFQKNIGFDYWLDTQTNTLHFASRTEVENTPYLSFSTGVNNGLNSMTRIVADSDTIFTRVYAYGSTENMPTRDIYDPSCLKENRLDLGEIPYIEKNVNKYGIIETVQVFDTIKPSYTSKVSNLDGLNRFNDTQINFNPNDYKVNNTNFSIVFSSGLCQGITFEVTNFDNGWFTINSTESGGIPMPSNDFQIKVGDSYTLINLNMPIEYIESAQAQLLKAAQEYLDDVSKPNDQFDLNIDSFYLMKRYKEMDQLSQEYKLDLGRNIYIVSNVHNIDGLFEIKEFRRKINNAFEIELKVGDVLPKTLLTKIKQIEFNSNNYSSVVNNSTTINNNSNAWVTF